MLQEKIEKMNQHCTDNYRQATALFADLFQSSEDGRANILGSAAKVIKFKSFLNPADLMSPDLILSMSQQFIDFSPRP